jgi:hypothetical protein
MSAAHRLYIAVLSVIVLCATTALIYLGYSYYQLPLEERFFHTAHTVLKPAGTWGHGFGIAGSLSMILGMLLYMARKRMRSLARFGLLKHWLEFHIFLCTLGPILVLFHTSFKFGGIVAISFWSMVAVFLSGIIGRFIYIQIPRTIEGRELSLSEVRDMKTSISEELAASYNLTERATLSTVKKVLKKKGLSSKERNKIVKLVKQERALNRRIDRLVTMQKVFRYWHVAHLPFALVMLIIMVIHVAVTIVFGYRWIF